MKDALLPSLQRANEARPARTVPGRGPTGIPREMTAVPQRSVLCAYTLRVRGIRFHAHIGVSAEERSVLQELVVDVDLTLSVEDLTARDLLEEVVDYDAVACRVVEEGVSGSRQLLETYAARVVERLLSDLPAMSVRVAVTKGKVPTKYPVEAAVVELVGSRRSLPGLSTTKAFEAPKLAASTVAR